MSTFSLSDEAWDVLLRLTAAALVGMVLGLNRDLKGKPTGARTLALVSLGAGLIEALPALESPQLKLQLGIHRCRYGIVAGLYSDTEQLSTEALRQGRRMQGKVRQPVAGYSHTSGAGVCQLRG